MEAIYVFRSNDHYLRKVQGTYCRVINKEEEIGKGCLAIEPLNNPGLRNQVVIRPGQYTKIRRKYNTKYLTFLIRQMKICKFRGRLFDAFSGI